MYNFTKQRYNQDYKVIIQSQLGGEKETKAQVYLVIYGDHGRTGKIEINDGKFEKSALDNYEFKAPDVGKVNTLKYNSNLKFR